MPLGNYNLAEEREIVQIMIVGGVKTSELQLKFIELASDASDMGCCQVLALFCRPGNRMEVGSVMSVQTAVGGWPVARTQACDHAIEGGSRSNATWKHLRPSCIQGSVHITNVSQDRRL